MVVMFSSATAIHAHAVLGGRDGIDSNRLADGYRGFVLRSKVSRPAFWAIEARPTPTLCQFSAKGAWLGHKRSVVPTLAASEPMNSGYWNPGESGNISGTLATGQSRQNVRVTHAAIAGNRLQWGSARSVPPVTISSCNWRSSGNGSFQLATLGCFSPSATASFR